MQTKQQFSLFRSIQTTLILWFGLIAIIPLVVVVAILLQRLEQEGQRQSFEKMQLVSEIRNAELERWLNNSRSTLIAALSDTTRNQRMVSLVAGELLPSARPATVRNLTAFFREQLADSSPFETLFLYTNSGDVALSTDASQNNQSVWAAPYYQSSLYEMPVVHPPYFDAELGQTVMFITTPILNQDQRQAGVLAGKLNLNQLFDILNSRTGLGVSGKTYLATDAFMLPPIGQGESVGIRAALDTQETSVSIYRDFRNTEVVGAYRWLPTFQAALLTEIDRDEAFATSAALQQLGLGVSAIALLVAVFVGGLVALQITRPILMLNRSARELSQGQFNVKIDINSRNEVGVLAHTFGMMANQIQDMVSLLETRVQERTRDLQIAAEVSSQITTVLDRDHLLKQIVESTRKGFDVYSVSIFVFDEKQHLLRRAANSGAAVSDKNFSLDENGLVPLAARNREPVVIDDVKQSANYFANPALPDTRSEIVIPILYTDQLLGVLDFQFDHPRSFIEQELKIFTTLAEQIAIALRNAQLFEATQAALQEAEKSNRVKSMFLASMSHELRTPLNSIINFTKFVTRGIAGPVSDKQLDMLNNVIESGEHLLSLINDVLDISKIESGSLKLLIEPNVSISQITDQVSKTALSLLGDKPVTLTVDVEDGLPLITGDKQRIHQSLLNIVSNACKFTPEGSIDIKAFVEADYIHISVADTGPGIAPEDEALVFEKFMQTDTGLEHGGGTGLGMPITKSLVEAHGGKIWIESQYGHGTTFHVTLPLEASFSKQFIRIS